MKDGKIYIVILNYNRWKDTIECLESVLKLDYLNYQVIVVDNNSSDNSFNEMISWAEGVNKVENTLFERLVFPLEKKPVSYSIIDINNVVSRKEKVLFLQTGENLGFAGGNNVAVRYILKQNDFSHIWFLNNDTVLEKKSLFLLKEYMDRKKNIGICGSKLVYYHDSKKIQGLAGYYNPMLGIGKHICNENELKNMSYVIGASMLVKKDFIEKIGLMNEFYFLYCEEIDWTERARGIFDIDICLDSIVYHKEGASIVTRSSFAEYYSLRNRLIFTWIYYKKYLLTVFIRMLMSIFYPFHKRPYKRLDMLKKVVRDAYLVLKKYKKI